MDVIHTAIWTSDLDRVREFYVDALGLEHTWEFELDGVTNFYVGTEDGAEIQFKYDPNREEPVEPSGIDHVALGVEDAEALFESVVEETGCPVHVEPKYSEPANARVAFIEDPDGYVVELVEDLD